MCAQGQNRSSHRAPRADSGTGEGASWGRAQLRARGGAAAPRAPAPRLSHVSSPRARAVAPEPAPPERLRAPGVSLRPPQHNRPGNGGPPSPRLAGGPRALLASGGLCPLHISTSGLTLMPKTAPGRAPPARRAPRLPGRLGACPGACHMSLGVCVCVFPCACRGLARLCRARRPARGVQGWILLRGPGLL